MKKKRQFNREIGGYSLEQQNPVVQIQKGGKKAREEICTERSDYFCKLNMSQQHYAVLGEADALVGCVMKKGYHAKCEVIIHLSVSAPVTAGIAASGFYTLDQQIMC